MIKPRSRVVNVRFLDARCRSEPEWDHREYTYLTDFDVETGDMALVLVGNVPKIVKVTQTEGLSEQDLRPSRKWLVSKIDLTEHRLREAKARKIQEIRNRLREQQRRYEELQLLAAIAPKDPEIAELLRELQQLDEGAADVLQKLLPDSAAATEKVSEGVPADEQSE